MIVVVDFEALPGFLTKYFNLRFDWLLGADFEIYVVKWKL